MIPGEVFEVAGEPFVMTRHACQRILDMRLDPDDVRACLERPDDWAQSKKYPGCHNWRYADFTLGIRSSAKAFIIITAVWATQDAWAADFAEADYEDRELRGHFSGPKA